MSTEIHELPETAHVHNSVVLKVRYIAARKRFIDQCAPRDESLSALKPRVLEFYGLAEGSVEGGTKTYHFAQGGVVLTDLSATLGSLAHGKHELDLDLIERFEQG